MACSGAEFGEAGAFRCGAAAFPRRNSTLLAHNTEYSMNAILCLTMTLTLATSTPRTTRYPWESTIIMSHLRRGFTMRAKPDHACLPPRRDGDERTQPDI
jgi:hypothetical protein